MPDPNLMLVVIALGAMLVGFVVGFPTGWVVSKRLLISTMQAKAQARGRELKNKHPRHRRRGGGRHAPRR